MNLTRRSLFKALAGMVAGGAVAPHAATETAATATTVIDSGQVWGVSQWQGGTVVLTATSSGQLRRIQSNAPDRTTHVYLIEGQHLGTTAAWRSCVEAMIAEGGR